MKLMVAGCSYSALSDDLPGTAWSEVLAKKLGWDLINLARQGCSNGGIRVQIDEILRQRPDFAIVTPTFWDRMEIPATAAPYVPREKENKGWAPDLQAHLQDRGIQNGYDRQAGMDNVNYGHNQSRMICETIFSLAENGPHRYRSGRISKEAQTAVKHYIDQLYDSNWKKQQDEWIIREGVYEMFVSGIKFLLVPVLLWPFDSQDHDQWKNLFPNLIPEHFVMSNERESVLPITGNNPFQGSDPGYHGSPLSQEIIANNYYRRITQDHSVI